MPGELQVKPGWRFLRGNPREVFLLRRLYRQRQQQQNQSDQQPSKLGEVLPFRPRQGDYRPQP